MKKTSAFITAVIIFVLTSCSENDKPEPAPTIAGNTVKAIFIDEHGIKWFGTENGVSAFDGTNWTTYTTADNLADNSVNDITFQQSYYGSEIWFATDAGASVFAVDLDAVSAATSYKPSNSGIGGDTVRSVALDTASTRWFGTNEGVSVFAGPNWAATSNDGILKSNPIHDIGTDPFGHAFITLKGKGVAVMNYIDAISTVTYYEIPWSPLPSANVLSVFVDENGYQWYGTDRGVAFHANIEAKQDWQSYTEEDGLISNVVICIKGDGLGNIWFGTPSGASRFDGLNWTSYTSSNGMAGNTVYAIAFDTDGSVWFGTNNGVSHLNGTTWTSYRKE
jgi:ligand-binding sensor domain-containing protein